MLKFAFANPAHSLTEDGAEIARVEVRADGWFATATRDDGQHCSSDGMSLSVVLGEMLWLLGRAESRASGYRVGVDLANEWFARDRATA